jgi:FOG: FHA domain
MALIRFEGHNDLLPLQAHQIIGRNAYGNTHLLSDRRISTIHCQVRWHNNGWWLKDLSKNGTWVNNTRCQPQVEILLQKGDCVALATENHLRFTLEDCSPPVATLVRLTEQPLVIQLQEMNALPDPSQPEVFIYKAAQGLWVCEQSQTTHTLSDGERLFFDEEFWLFIDSRTVDYTIDAAPSQLHSATPAVLHFSVSQDQEHTFLKVESAGQYIDLGERTHHFLLLTLARKRQEDINNHIATEECGWLDMDELSRMLGLEVAHTNIQIFRARKQICEALSPALPPLQLIERRRGAARIGNLPVHISCRVMHSSGADTIFT